MWRFRSRQVPPIYQELLREQFYRVGFLLNLSALLSNQALIISLLYAAQSRRVLYIDCGKLVNLDLDTLLFIIFEVCALSCIPCDFPLCTVLTSLQMFL